MRGLDLIIKKRDGESLTKEEIAFLIQSYSQDQITDYQMAAWAMAVYFQGLDNQETFALTKAMIESGEIIKFPLSNRLIADKHSTGGVGDTTTLILVPLVAAAGVFMAKVSGRGLGFTGGTIDKLESIPGFSVELTNKKFISQVNEIGLAITSQTANLVPVDKKLYSLRDVTGTVESLPLIAASIMSKKIAAGANIILLDVKAGRGAFMKTKNEAIALAQLMVEIGKNFGIPTTALISSMEEPLGHAVGNALEVKEAIETLKGNGPADLVELCLTLGSEILVLAKKVKEIQEGKEVLNELLNSGKALEKFCQMVEFQGGNSRVIHQTELLPGSLKKLEVVSTKNGFINSIDSQEVGKIAAFLGAGRSFIGSSIDLSVGIQFKKKTGDFVEKNETLAIVHSADTKTGEIAIEMMLNCIEITDIKNEKPSLLLAKVTNKEIIEL